MVHFVPALLDRARTVARGDSAQYGATYVSVPYSRRLWELGLLQARTGSAIIAAAAAAELQRRASTADSGYVRGRAASLMAFAQLARRDSAGAERAFTTLITTAAADETYEWDEAGSLAAERLTLAQLLQARGAAQQAIDVASVLDSRWQMMHLQYLAPSLELRASAAKSLGNKVLESKYLARLAALRGGA